ncbi:hypothetical protein B0T25DRAFT_632582 [Lasiosphaeria hispida]|uniref:F-box domain-containing protein n=1 Tax=Lasiosphaeria hispida TaxID=260671 RepID=A0AAJ0HDT2_9PEZI|nr:hypothetical protein B0T25DRAFT_632582 [Lasiosphaeria hispida]
MGCQLLDLPEELLLDIMKLLDPTSIQCLRRADRAFLRLFSDKSFHHWHASSSDDPHCRSRFPWCHGNPEFGKQAYDKPSSFRYLMHLDETRKQCVLCQNTNVENPRKAWDLVHKHLFCDACLVDHPTAFFSAAERGGEKKIRTCIGHTGYIRLCEHEIITRHDVTRLWSQILEMSSAAAEYQYLWIKECRHPSHAPVAHYTLGEGTKKAPYPSAVLAVHGNAVVIDMQWTGHLRLPSDVVVSGDDMAACLGELRRGAGEFLAPQAVPGMIPEMRCFDPNKCGCLENPKYPATSRWAGMPMRGGGNGCRSDPAQRLLPMIRSAKGQVVATREEATREEEEPHMGEGAHNALTYINDALGTLSGWCVEVDGCPSGEPCLRFTYARTVICGAAWQPEWRTVDYSWFQALDPDSYRLWEDQDTKGTLWCLDANCPNYYRYSERPIIRKYSVASGAVFYEEPKPPVGSWRIKGVLYQPLQDEDSILAEQARLADKGAGDIWVGLLGAIIVVLISGAAGAVIVLLSPS